MAITANDVRWTLADIRSKVRKLTGRPSTNQVTDNTLDEYINRYYTQDLPSQLGPRDADSWWRLSTLVNVQRYSNEDGNFNLYGPLYINGDEAELFTDPVSFYQKYPKSFVTRESAGTGDGSTATFTGTLGQTPINPEAIVFDDDFETLTPRPLPKITNISQAATAIVTTERAHNLTTGDQVKIIGVRNGMVEIDNVQSTVTVNTSTTFQLDSVNSSNFTPYQSGGEVLPIEFALLAGDFGGSGRVTLASGAFSITFNSAPADGQDLRASYEAFDVGIPVAALFYDRSLVFSPTPDGSYLVESKIKKRPSPLLAETDAILFNDWGKLIAYGASIDFLYDEAQQDAAMVLEAQFRRLLITAKRRDITAIQDERSVPRF